MFQHRISRIGNVRIRNGSRRKNMLHWRGYLRFGCLKKADEKNESRKGSCFYFHEINIRQRGDTFSKGITSA